MVYEERSACRRQLRIKEDTPGRRGGTVTAAFERMGRAGPADLRRANRAALLEALAAENRPTLRGSERNRGFLAALGTGGFGLGTHLRSAAAHWAALGAFGLAAFTALRFVLEALIGEEHLLAASKNEFGAALGALQYFIVEFHEPIPLNPVGQGRWAPIARTLHPFARITDVVPGDRTPTFGPAGSKLQADPNNSA
jgi:hypothetical protein